ncbi:hypothetical protein DSECCO2_380670 [anaerobic digester metagenome]
MNPHGDRSLPAIIQHFRKGWLSGITDVVYPQSVFVTHHIESLMPYLDLANVVCQDQHSQKGKRIGIRDIPHLEQLKIPTIDILHSAIQVIAMNYSAIVKQTGAWHHDTLHWIGGIGYIPYLHAK